MHEVNINNLDLNLLVALEALLETQSVSKAAEKINLSQPAMSRALDRLRHMMGDPLLVRSGRSMVMTPRAESLQAPLRDALMRVRHVLAPHAFDPASSKQKFHIIGPDYVTQLIFAPVLEQLYMCAPHISVEIGHMSLDNLASLKAGEIDLGIGVINDGPDMSSAYHQPLFEDRFVCLVRDTHPLAKKGLTIEGYAKASHALLSVTGRGASAMDERLAKFGLARKIALRLPHFLSIHSVIRRSDLITTIPKRLAEQASLEGLKLLDLPAEIDGPNFVISQIWHERFTQDPARKWLRSIVKGVAEGL